MDSEEIRIRVDSVHGTSFSALSIDTGLVVCSSSLTLNQCHDGMREHRRGRGSELTQGRSWTLELSGVASVLFLFHLQGAPPALRFPVNRSDGYGADIHRH